jgi:hypothetical protein
MRHDPTENGELISAWAEDRPVDTSAEWDSIGEGSAAFLALQDERAKLLEAESKHHENSAGDVSLSSDEAQALERRAMFLKGKAAGIRYTSTLLVEAIERAKNASPKEES